MTEERRTKGYVRNIEILITLAVKPTNSLLKFAPKVFGIISVSTNIRNVRIADTNQNKPHQKQPWLARQHQQHQQCEPLYLMIK